MFLIKELHLQYSTFCIPVQSHLLYNVLMQYFLYARKSTDTEDKQVLSIEAQLSELRSLAKRDRLDVVEELVEKRSAKTPGRPVFEEMMRRVEKGEASGIICWKIDRLSRNPVDSGRISWLLQQGTIAKIITHDRVYLPHDNVPRVTATEREADETFRIAGPAWPFVSYTWKTSKNTKEIH